MILAITYDMENESVWQHYGETPRFKMYQIEAGNVVKTWVLESGEYSHTTLATLLGMNGVDVLIAGGMGSHAVETLQAEHIEILNGVEGSIDNALKDFLNGKLVFDQTKTHCCGCHH